MKNIIIAIDGHSSCGKSTLAKSVAKKLSYTYVDTGAMYRAIALAAERNGLISNYKINNIDRFKELLSRIEVAFTNDASGQSVVTLDGEIVESEIRTMQISNIVSNISTVDEVRSKLVALQQAMGDAKRIVMDGRDIGTVVFPQAELKIFLTAKAETRAQRRYDELVKKGDTVQFQEVLDNIKQRDHLDETRAISPLRKADDAITIDNSQLNREEQLDEVLKLIKDYES